MKTIEDFTDIQKKKFLFAQNVSNILTIYGIQHKIGGSFVDFLKYNKEDFHDVDIIIDDMAFDYAINTLSHYLKYHEHKTVYSLDYKNRCQRLDFGDDIIIDILTDVMHPESYPPIVLDTFHDIKLETQGNVYKARKLIKDNILPQFIMAEDINKLQYNVLHICDYENIILKLYGDFIITHNRNEDCTIFFNKLEKDDRYNELDDILNLPKQIAVKITHVYVEVSSK